MFIFLFSADIAAPLIPYKSEAKYLLAGVRHVFASVVSSACNASVARHLKDHNIINTLD